MSGIATILLTGFAAYVVAGIAIAAVFVVGAASRALPEPAPVTLGARLLMAPGAIALWPVVLRRWLTSLGTT